MSYIKFVHCDKFTCDIYNTFKGYFKISKNAWCLLCSSIKSTDFPRAIFVFRVIRLATFMAVQTANKPEYIKNAPLPKHYMFRWKGQFKKKKNTTPSSKNNTLKYDTIFKKIL